MYANISNTVRREDEINNIRGCPRFTNIPAPQNSEIRKIRLLIKSSDMSSVHNGSALNRTMQTEKLMAYRPTQISRIIRQKDSGLSLGGRQATTKTNKKSQESKHTTEATQFTTQERPLSQT